MNDQRKRSMATLIDVLKSQKDDPHIDSWQEFECHVQNVYQTLLKLDGENVLVGRNVAIRGRTGSSYNIDVYYEFEHVGIRHRVAIECKNLNRPVDRDRVLAFSAKISDCPGVRGCIVAENGYQSGADKFAEDNCITAITRSELPSIGKLLGMRLENNVIPTDKTIGQPFWSLYELDTGTPMGSASEGNTYGLLFFSKLQAQEYLDLGSYGANVAVRGLSQENLRTFILVVESMGGRFVLAQVTNDDGRTPSLGGVEIDRGTLIKEFYLENGSLPEEPMVAPPFR